MADAPGDVPTVYFTLGTVYNMESGDLFQRVMAGLRDLAADVIVTVGRDLDPDELGPQPPNVHIERFVPQAELLPHCDLVVSHAGSGSVLGALAHGLPMVLIPIGADQPLNAARCRDAGGRGSARRRSSDAGHGARGRVASAGGRRISTKRRAHP